MSSPYPIRCVFWGAAGTGKSRHLRSVLRKNPARRVRDDVNTLDDLRRAEEDGIEVIATESREVARAAQRGGAMVMGTGDERLWKEMEARVEEHVLPQPPPKPAEGDVWAEIIDALKREDPADPLLPYAVARRQMGIDKYGTPLQRENGRDHRRDALQEALDGMAYSRADGDAAVAGLFETAARLVLMRMEGRR